MSQIKVLYVIPKNPGAYRISSFYQREVESLAELGVETHVFMLRSRTSPRVLAADWLHFRRIVSEINPDIVHAQYGTMTAFFTTCATLKPIVTTFRGSDLNPVTVGHPLRLFLSRLMSQFAAWRASAIVCVSGQLKKRLWSNTDRAAVLTNGIDLKLFVPMKKVEARRALNMPEQGYRVLFNAGALEHHKIKRLDLAEAAFALLKNALPDVHLDILRGQISAEDIPLHINAADCLLLTSDHEGSPSMVKEAMACNLPVISMISDSILGILRKN
ncbi:MAG: glycosyltransferase family 4 protein [Elusimicrobia bacterium]|nr:glycosyltransferase family 4 protein [Elusimicrobiota bacterium]